MTSDLEAGGLANLWRAPIRLSVCFTVISVGKGRAYVLAPSNTWFLTPGESVRACKDTHYISWGCDPPDGKEVSCRVLWRVDEQ